MEIQLTIPVYVSHTLRIIGVPDQSFQDIPLFENLTGGFYTIVVEDKNGCRPNATLEVSVIEYPKFFTPNNDGINDTWNIKWNNISNYKIIEVNIYNRYGKILKKLNSFDSSWDGTYDGKLMPPNDYWVSIKLVPMNENKRIIIETSNFSLIR